MNIIVNTPTINHNNSQFDPFTKREIITNQMMIEDDNELIKFEDIRHLSTGTGQMVYDTLLVTEKRPMRPLS